MCLYIAGCANNAVPNNSNNGFANSGVATTNTVQNAPVSPVNNANNATGTTNKAPIAGILVGGAIVTSMIAGAIFAHKWVSDPKFDFAVIKHSLKPLKQQGLL